MENINKTEQIILDFLDTNKCSDSIRCEYGNGDVYGGEYGYGDGYGYGCGNEYGDGYGTGYGDCGYGCGYEDGCGDGDGYRYGIKTQDGVKYLNKQKVYDIDGIQTLIDSLHGNYAKGRILMEDLTTNPCYIVKQGTFFAHGKTLKEAFADVVRKSTMFKPVKERIREFNRKFPNRDVKYPASELFLWHNILTGSCFIGRKNFCEQHGLDYKNGAYTINEFISLTRDAYGGDIIKKLEQIV